MERVSLLIGIGTGALILQTLEHLLSFTTTRSPIEISEVPRGCQVCKWSPDQELRGGEAPLTQLG